MLEAWGTIAAHRTSSLVHNWALSKYKMLHEMGQ